MLIFPYFVMIGFASRQWRSSHYAFMHVSNKNNNIQGRSSNVVNLIYHAIRNCSYRKEFAPSGDKFFPLREVPIMKRDAHKSPFDVRNFFSALATPLLDDRREMVITL